MKILARGCPEENIVDMLTGKKVQGSGFGSSTGLISTSAPPRRRDGGIFMRSISLEECGLSPIPSTGKVEWPVVEADPEDSFPCADCFPSRSSQHGLRPCDWVGEYLNTISLPRGIEAG